MNNKGGKGLRTLGIVLMAITAAMNILGGVGTVCAAFLTKKFPPMWALYDYRLLYQALMIITILLGIAGVWAAVSLGRGAKRAYWNALILLVVGTIVAGIHVYASLALRGKAIPANFKLYANALTLLVFLIFRLPGLRSRVNFDRPKEKGSQAASGGLAAIMAGITCLTTTHWVGASHLYLGNNWVDVLKTPLMVGGSLLLLGGAILLLKPILSLCVHSLQQRLRQFAR